MRRLLGPAAALALGLMSFVFFATGGAQASADNSSGTTSAASASASSPSTASSAYPPSLVTKGHQLFIQHCSACHGIDGAGIAGRAPSLTNVGAAAVDFYLQTGRMPLNDPRQQATRHPPFFPQDQIDALIAYVASLGPGPGIPAVEPVCKGNQTSGCTTLAEGEQLFQYNCAECHQAVGAGGMLSKGDVIPSLKHATAVQVAEAVRVGPQPMPKFGREQLSDHEVSAIANYVQFIRKPPNRGGLNIGHFGPIPEGFVGIIFGLGALLIASRLIGTRG